MGQVRLLCVVFFVLPGLVLSCLVEQSFRSLLATLQLMSKFNCGGPILVSVVTFVVHVNEKMGWCWLNQSGFRLLVSELSYQLSSSLCLRRCRTVLVDYMLGQYGLKMFKAWLISFTSLVKLNISIYTNLTSMLDIYFSTILQYYILLSDRAKYLHKWLTTKPQTCAPVNTKFEIHWNFPYLRQHSITLLYRVYKKKLNKPEIALRLCKAPQCTKFFIEIGCLGTDNAV